MNAVYAGGGGSKHELVYWVLHFFMGKLVLTVMVQITRPIRPTMRPRDDEMIV